MILPGAKSKCFEILRVGIFSWNISLTSVKSGVDLALQYRIVVTPVHSHTPIPVCVLLGNAQHLKNLASFETIFVGRDEYTLYLTGQILFET